MKVLFNVVHVPFNDVLFMKQNLMKEDVTA